MTHDHISRLRAHIEAGTLVRNKWTGTDAQGRETACLLAAMVPKCGEEGSADACPADVMPRWLAHLTPWIDDAGSAEAWPGVVQRYADLASRWHVLTADDWDALHKRVRAACVREDMRHTTDAHVISVCADIAETLESGEWPTEGQRKAAWEAWTARADRAAWAAEAAAITSAAWAAAAAARAVLASARAAAANRLIKAILDLIEAKIVERTTGP